MIEDSQFSPIQLTSRAVQSRRIKFRLYCLSLVSAFALGCAAALTPGLESAGSEELAAHELVALGDLSPTAYGMVPKNSLDTPEIPLVTTPEPQYPKDMDLTVQGGDTFISLLTDVGVSSNEAHELVDSIRSVYNPRKLAAGQTLTVQLDKDTQNAGKVVVASLTFPTSPTSTLEIIRNAKDDFEVKTHKAELFTKIAKGGGEITSSLYETGLASGIPASLLADIINAYSYDVDFQRDIKRGDAIEVLYERLETKEGIVAGNGKLLHANLELGGRNLKIYSYTDKKGVTDYYNEKGESVRKALLRTPINGARISSGFGMRNHPILGYSKMHRGVDFAAPTGTPIYAAGDGVVSFAGIKGGYGNYLKITHNGTYASAYAHLSRFAKGMRAGTKVKQGQIVAYVGSTGMSTGPHLHYEIHKNGAQVNPAGVKFKTGTVLAGNELKDFKKNVQQLQAKLESMPMPTRVAMNDTKRKSRVN